MVKGFKHMFAQVRGRRRRHGRQPQLPVFLAATRTRQADASLRSMGSSRRRPAEERRYLEPVPLVNIYFGYGAGMGRLSPHGLHKS